MSLRVIAVLSQDQVENLGHWLWYGASPRISTNRITDIVGNHPEQVEIYNALMSDGRVW